ncbi:hypothetical protein BDP27DRAFT_1331373, partial [Rhodocollybia butyracea]
MLVWVSEHVRACTSMYEHCTSRYEHVRACTSMYEQLCASVRACTSNLCECTSMCGPVRV